MKNKSETKNGFRFFTCKICGKRNLIPISAWKKMPQKEKNICAICLEKRHTARLDSQERNMMGGWYPFYQ